MAEKKITRAEDAPKKVKHTIKPAAEGNKPAESSAKPAAPVKGKSGALGYRIGAVVLWVAAIAFEIIAVLLLVGKLEWTFMSTLALVIIALVLDLICVIAGSLLWKKSNLLDPASEKNKLKFWLWNNMGLIVCAFAFVPFIIIALTNKNADKKTKTIATVVAVIALLIGGLFSYDWNPISAEEKADAIAEYSGETVYWSTFGKVYHLDENCSHLNRSDELTAGTVEQAIEANRTRVCKTCEAKRASGELDDKSTDDESDENEAQETEAPESEETGD
ncbi:MAG: hypothetical protein IJJ99_01985 [Oscillospiraceae bacterium]|nr:hypothetical protein [Oscillospiraceae bacterium]